MPATADARRQATSDAETWMPHLLTVVEVARRSRAEGNHPFGAVVVDADGEVVATATNTVGCEHDLIGHAETNVVRDVGLRHEPDELEGMTLVTSAEPCVMCAGATYWAGLGRVVYALSESELAVLTGDDPQNLTMAMPCREVFARGRRRIEVIGPVDVPGAREVHDGFWLDA
ncbi:nucleoside deaminase [Dietzia cinnamea]|uniref:Nucleoside deaminase n=1 Tax=Dietzia cinnamea TaxID=321318 RepID=A0ABV3YEB1_9ACTN|nr:nucleoside deaminase [Dietzia cinnamea]MCT1883887.1 nucleoside deaminase [Dietzia cinnamea]